MLFRNKVQTENFLIEEERFYVNLPWFLSGKWNFLQSYDDPGERFGFMDTSFWIVSLRGRHCDRHKGVPKDPSFLTRDTKKIWGREQPHLDVPEFWGLSFRGRCSNCGTLNRESTPCWTFPGLFWTARERMRRVCKCIPEGHGSGNRVTSDSTETSVRGTRVSGGVSE